MWLMQSIILQKTFNFTAGRQLWLSHWHPQ